MTTHRIVVGVDGSAPSQQALRWAAQIAAGLGAGIRAVSVWDLPTNFGWAAWPTGWDPARDAHQLLTETIATAFGGRPPVPIEELVRQGSAARILVEEGRFATMIVVGSRGHGGVTGVLLGSVSAKVAEYADCPVLVVHGDQLPEIPPRKEEATIAR